MDTPSSSPSPAHSCPVCADLKDRELASQKFGWEQNDTHFPPAASRLIVVRDIRPGEARAKQIWQCPECRTFYLYESDYEYLVNGSEDNQSLTRLTGEFAGEYLGERAGWLIHIRKTLQDLYDAIAPEYWIKYGFYNNETHLAFLEKLLESVPPESRLLSAACGAGRYDGMLAAAGHRVLGIDQSEGMLRRAREMVPGVEYRRLGLQEMEFDAAFEGIVCLDAMENIPPEDWAGILTRFSRALKPGGCVYFTLERPDSAAEIQESFERAKAKGLPVVYGEVADMVEEAVAEILALIPGQIPDELLGKAAYHYYPAAGQVLAWLTRAGFQVTSQGSGLWYDHFLAKKVTREF